MVAFWDLWMSHPGHGQVCDDPPFENQCAMRMGHALRSCGVDLAGGGFRTCLEYNRRRFAGHAPGHIRSAQQLASFLERHPERLGRGVTCARYQGTIARNRTVFKTAKGVIFILNGWGRTDHIDVWQGNQMKGGYTSYQDAGEAVWLWAM